MVANQGTYYVVVVEDRGAVVMPHTRHYYGIILYHSVGWSCYAGERKEIHPQLRGSGQGGGRGGVGPVPGPPAGETAGQHRHQAGGQHWLL